MKSIKRIAEVLVPKKYHLVIRFWYLRLFLKLDPEMFYVKKLLESKKRFIDIGSNIGMYSYYFSRSFSNIDAFEPIPEITYRLKALKSNEIKIHEIALSDSNSQLDIYIPVVNGKPLNALASLEKRSGDVIKQNVEVRSLDSYKYADVDLIKIDVEGHEKSVLLGAEETINKCRPILIIEIEQRHICFNISQVFDIVLSFNYDGYFIRNNRMEPLSSFNYKRDQAPYKNNVKDKNYINNFIFISR
jgi:FkbM family methyltransferase